MAIDKVIDSAKLDTALTATANAIREKNGITDPIAWDNNTGFANAVENIEAGGGGGTELADAIIERSVTEVNSNADKVGDYTFYSCSSLTSVNFPVAISIGSSAFYSCSSLTSVNFPVVTRVGSNAFYACSSLTSANFPVATRVGNGAFCACSSLTTANFPAATSIGSSAFGGCYSLTTANFPAATRVGSSAFAYCSSLTTANFPAVTSIGISAFAYCLSLTEVNFPAATSIGASAFRGCSALVSLYLLGSSLCALANSIAFSGTGITSSTGAIYVPASLLASYQSATNWAYFSTQFVAGD